MSNKRTRTLIRKRKPGRVTRLQARQARLSTQDREQKLSGLIKDMGLSLLKDPDTIPSPGAAQAALTLATVAWNSAVGDTMLPEDYGKVIEQISRGDSDLWSELRCDDIDELVAVRVFPPPLPGLTEHVVFTTPYLLLHPGQRQWQAYFRRTLPDAPLEDRIAAYERHMKFGPARDYWTEFVFEAYVNHRTDVILLAGLPDVPESRPHSRVNSR